MKLIKLILVTLLIFAAFIPFDFSEEKPKSIIDDKITIVEPPALPEPVEVPKIEMQEISIIEYDPPIKKLTPFINPNKIPITKPWNLKISGGETISNLTNHLYIEHNVEKHLILGWNLTQLRRLHAYCHNGYRLEDLYEYF